MIELILKAPAKVNLSLRVVGRRANGYHELDMLMAPTDLYDMVNIRIAEAVDTDINVMCSDKRMQGEHNIAYKAAEALLKYSGNINRKGININIEKNIPVGAGLGGGSVDAAAVIVGLDKLLDLKLDKGQLIKIGHGIGSDVPFCIEAVLNATDRAQPGCSCSLMDKGFMARVGGTGEKIQSLSIKKFKALLVNPGFEVNTSRVYKKFDEMGLIGSPPNIVDKMEKTLINNRSFSFDEYFTNDLTVPAFCAYPRLEEARDEIITTMKKSCISSTSSVVSKEEKMAAMNQTNMEDTAHMVGSGATFMIFTDEHIKKERAFSIMKKTLSCCIGYQFRMIPVVVG